MLSFFFNPSILACLLTFHFISFHSLPSADRKEYWKIVEAVGWRLSPVSRQLNSTRRSCRTIFPASTHCQSGKSSEAHSTSICRCFRVISLHPGRSRDAAAAGLGSILGHKPIEFCLLIKSADAWAFSQRNVSVGCLSLPLAKYLHIIYANIRSNAEYTH